MRLNRIYTLAFAACAALFFIGILRTTVANEERKTDTIVLSGGCFWCMQAIYERVPGVVKVTSGYAGGSKENPTYEEVGTGRTGHAESILVEFDPAQTNLRSLVDFFWKSFDPTDARGVAPDFGPEYRTLILYHTDEQKQVALESKAEAQKQYSKPIVTEIKPLTRFWPAEAYHQDYVRYHPNEPYVQSVTIPRLTSVGVWGKPIVAEKWPAVNVAGR